MNTSAYLNRIFEVYPDLVITDCEPNDIGQNNDVLIINESLVFKFPKYSKGVLQLKQETEILKYIKSMVPLPVPDPIYLSLEKLEPGLSFTGYQRIDGEPLWRDSFEKVQNPEVVRKVAFQLMNFLKELHNLPKNQVEKTLKLQDTNALEEVNDLYQQFKIRLFPYMREEKQREVTESFERFFNQNEKIETKLIHGDFGASNILWDREVNEVSGIIDFGGSGLGDQAYDFAGILSSYGQNFFNLCMEFYPNGKEISERVKFYRSTFALQEALHGLDNNDQKAFVNGIKDYR